MHGTTSDWSSEKDLCSLWQGSWNWMIFRIFSNRRHCVWWLMKFSFHHILLNKIGCESFICKTQCSFACRPEQTAHNKMIFKQYYLSWSESKFKINLILANLIFCSFKEFSEVWFDRFGFFFLFVSLFVIFWHLLSLFYIRCITTH